LGFALHYIGVAVLDIDLDDSGHDSDSECIQEIKIGGGGGVETVWL
jgi:hypothetical protein